MGTLILILLRDGVVANVLLKRSKAEGAGWMVITSGWCFAVLAGIFTAVACGSNDAHINPAVTVGFAVVTGNHSKVIPYITAHAGSILRSSSCLAALSPSLEGNPGAFFEVGRVLYGARDSQSHCESG